MKYKFNPLANEFNIVTSVEEQLISGGYYSFKSNDGKSSQSIAANTLICSKIFIPENFTLQSLVLRFGTAVAGNAVVGIYSITKNGIPGTKIVQVSSPFVMSTTAAQTMAVTATKFKRGFYGVVYLGDTVNNINAFTNASTFPNFGIDGSILATGVFATYISALAYTATLPNTFPAGAQSLTVAPYVLLRKQ